MLDKASARRWQTTTTSNNKNNNIDTNNTNNNNNNNNDDNNDNDNNTNSQRSSLQSLDQNKESQESSLNSFDLDNDNPESDLSGSDLDESSLGSFTSEMGSVESSFSSQDQQEAACSLDKHHLGTLGHQMMTIGFSLGSLNQNNQKGMIMDRDSFEEKKPRKKVHFSEATLEAYEAKQQNDNKQNKGSHPGGLQLEQLRPNNQQQSWHNEPRRMQQQPAAASEKKLEHRPCNHNNLVREDESLGSLEQNASTTNLRACRCPKLNNNTAAS